MSEQTSEQKTEQNGTNETGAAGDMATYDVLVVGAGPGGYVAAIRAAQLGLNVACCEWQAYADPKGQPRLGGTCLNVGCIPSKSLLHSSELFAQAQGGGLASHGIQIGQQPVIDVPKMKAHKDKVVTQLTGGIRQLFKKNKVTFLSGRGQFVAAAAGGWQMQVGDQAVFAKQVVIATGSRARHLPGIEVDNQVILDNVGALDQLSVPKKLAIIGAGVIGLEMGLCWARLGADVHILEALPDFLAAADQDVAKEAFRIFKKKGLTFELGVKIEQVERVSGSSDEEQSVRIAYQSSDGEARTLEADRLIVSVGRVPNTDGLNGEAVGLAMSERGFIEVDDYCRSNLEGVWAIGDVVRGPMLAHKASEEGVMVAERMIGQAGHCNVATIPWVIYTEPEIAWVGKTEQQLQAAGIAYQVGKMPFAANGRALSMDEGQGFVKMLADAKTDRVLGVHIIGASASELIAECVVAMEFDAASEDIARICHAHPTLSEAIHEAALACGKRALHI